MKINVTEFNRERFLNWNDVVAWLDCTIGKTRSRDNMACIGDGWRLYSTENTIEGFYESVFWLEFDDEIQATNFLLRWS